MTRTIHSARGKKGAWGMIKLQKTDQVYGHVWTMEVKDVETAYKVISESSNWNIDFIKKEIEDTGSFDDSEYAFQIIQ